MRSCTVAISIERNSCPAYKLEMAEQRNPDFKIFQSHNFKNIGFLIMKAVGVAKAPCSLISVNVRFTLDELSSTTTTKKDL